MTHTPYFNWMHMALDDDLPAEETAQLHAHLHTCADCQTLWASLTAADQWLQAQPLAQPRPGFTGRFKARVAQQRSGPRLWWGLLTLGLSSGAGAMVALLMGFNLFASTMQVAQQPALALALFHGLTATFHWALALSETAWVLARTVGWLLALNPWLWALMLLCLLASVSILLTWTLTLQYYARKVFAQ